MPMTDATMGYKVYASDLSTLADDVICHLRNGEFLKTIFCINPHSYYIARSDERFNEALRNSDWLLPDGAGIILASMILGLRFKKRITGHDIFIKLMEKVGPLDSIFLLGSTQSTLMIIASRLSIDYPQIKVAGMHSPTFCSEFTKSETDSIINKINNSGANILLVAMTAPKQEKWIFQNKQKLKPMVAMGIGAVFDFYAGNVKRSPKLFRAIGLEWLPRLVQQPRRLWKRTFVSAPVFIFDLLVARLRKSL